LSVEEAGSKNKKSAVRFYYLSTLLKELQSRAEWRREGLQSRPCPNQAGRKKREIFFSEPASSTLNGHLFWSRETDNIFSTKMYHIELLNSP
jgi:hypothetical protein